MSLSTQLPQRVVATVAWRRDYGLLATPDSFRLNQNPLGANRLPQVPISVSTIRHRRHLSLAGLWWHFPRLASLPEPSLSSSRMPGFEVSLAAMFYGNLRLRNVAAS